MVKERKKGTRRGALRRKLLRDMRGNFMQFFAMVVLCFLGTWVFAGLDANWRMEEYTIESWLAEGQLCDYWVRGSAFSRQDVYRLRAMDGVEFVQPRVTLTADCPDLPGTVTASVHAFQGEIRLNIPRLRSGEALRPSDARGCLVEEQFAAAQGLAPGDRLTLSVNDREQDFIVRGTVLSPEYLITSQDTTPDPKTYGFVLTSAAAFEDYPFNDLLLRVSEGADRDRLEREIRAALPDALVISQKTHGATVTCRSYVSLFRNMSYLFPCLAYFVAALVVMTTIRRLMDTQRTQMGTLKALGYGNGSIRRHYVSYALWPSLIGSSAGLAAAQVTLPQILWKMIATNMRVPEVRMAPISPLSWGLAGAEVVLAVGLCVYHEHKLARESAADLLRPKPPKAGSRILLERLPFLWRRFSFNAKMILRNIARNKGRTFLMLVGMLFCNMLIICSFGLQESIPYFIHDYYAGTVGYEVRAELTAGRAGELDAYRARLDAAAVDGVMEISVTFRTAAESRVSLLTVLPEDTTLLRLGPDHTLLPLPPEGLVLTEKMADLMRTGLGETVELWLSGETEAIPLRVETLADSNISQGAYMSRTAWERLRKGAFTPTALLIRGLTERGSRQLDDMEEVDRLKYPAEQERETSRFMDSASSAFAILSFVALGLAFVICYNMGLLNFTERTREYATLKVLGYHQKEIRRLILRENDLTALLGVSLGVVPGMLLVRVILEMCEFETMNFEPYISWTTLLFSSAITFVFTWLIEWLLSRKVRGIDMVEALKSVE